MNRAEHIAEAERLLLLSNNLGPTGVSHALARAQVHAALAALATAAPVKPTIYPTDPVSDRPARKSK